ncbi:hydroxyacylglutathione hydrolase [Polaromonas sp. SM01]|uniref:hydroxyacylglutathione hydrolase n=1 Tax=Polaromonas sp. SM01 TaxID=3085630 RepID=UPI00298222CC|nr:hydroxyacylglutathione hydrolase [Polaromonas sp. SM01]MDW5444965.1 hydroxyacylglutathione hydrolase [Polaromonas sp. SM01]
MTLIPIPAFNDNYLWLLHDGRRALVVDPGDAQPVLRVLQENGLQLESILVTHHHADHTGGVDELREATGAKVVGPARESIPEPFQRLQDGDTVRALDLNFQVIDVPGHTAGHIAYYLAPTLSASRDALPPEGAHPAWGGPAPDGLALDSRPLLFCGDTLFSGGCGRLFEGTPAQMLASLDRLAALPGNTRVCCTHEYTLSNLRFALAVEPDNIELIGYHARCASLRDQGQPTLPTTVAQELLINPFLRTRQATVMAAARRFDPAAHDDNTVFAAIRQWKNQFK